MKIQKSFYLSAGLALALASCATQKNSNAKPLLNVSTLKMIESADHLSSRKSPLSEEDKKRWSHLDIIKDTVPGMSVDKAYAEIIKNTKGNKVVVAVIDSGIEVDHEDLVSSVWNNPKEEINGKDDDNNGFVDDINGWNFLGESNEENLEMTRIVKLGQTNTENYKKAKEALDKELKKYKPIYDSYKLVIQAYDVVSNYFLGKETLTMRDVDIVLKGNAPENVKKSAELLSKIGSNIERLKGVKEYFGGKFNYHLNTEFDGRAVVGDNPYDINDKYYGNNDVIGERNHAKHGTHVAGIIAQTRNNGKGGDGVADQVAEIMAIRAVPDGDEYDKDIALAIRYAVDNGAKVINGSFGKYFATNSEWVLDAIKYAADHDVLMVMAAGNDSKDLNTKGGRLERYPNDVKDGKEIADNFLVVGALAPSFDENMVADFSNYGQQDVDVFAPGVEIYATVPNGKYEFLQGTSMASPNVAGVAALIRSYFPNLTASEVKRVIMDSGIAVNKQVIVGDDEHTGKETRNFKTISTSGKMVNAYNALILASKRSK